MGRTRRLGCTLLAAGAVALGAATAATATATAGGGYYTQMAPPEGVALHGSPYRFETFVLGRRHRVTVVERIDRRRGLVSRRWELRGAWHLSAPAYDGEGVGVGAEAPLLVLTRYGAPRHSLLRARTELAFLYTGSGRSRAPSRFHRTTLPGDYTVQAISPDGEFVYLAHNLSVSPNRGPRFILVPYSLQAHMLLPANDIAGNGEILSGIPVARTEDPKGRRVFTLYMNAFRDGGAMYLRVLGTEPGSLAATALPGLRNLKNPFLLDLHLSPSGRILTIRKHSSRHWIHREKVVARIDLPRRFGELAERALPPSPAPTDPVGSFARTVGESRQGRPIELREVGDLALPMSLLVFACIHGDECGAGALEPLRGGCPDGGAHVDVVPNLDPDGSAVRSRLNARGVDLNRNFATDWRPIGSPGNLEYSGPRAFSEPETRLAARLIRRLEPRVTIWFHQHWGGGSFVRAWGPSVPAARRFAHLSGLGFRLLRWPAGTAPNWQNHRFPGSASFVVELPRGKLPQRVQIRLDEALGRFGEEVGEDPRVARRG
jgi:protein MpaA